MFKVPANHVEARKVVRYYTAEEQADLDFKTSGNKIGEIVNLSQELNTIMWEKVNSCLDNGIPNDEIYASIEQIYLDICQLNVMSCIEIDKAKKEFDVKMAAEINRIKQKYLQKDEDGRTIKPKFIGYIAKTKGYYDDTKKNYKKHRTTMDYVVTQVEKHRSPMCKPKNFVLFSRCFQFPGYHVDLVNKRHVDRIISAAEYTANNIQIIYSSPYYSSAEKYLLTSQEKEILLDVIDSLDINVHTLRRLLYYTDNEKYTHIGTLLFHVLVSYKMDLLAELIKHEQTEAVYLEKCDDGDVDLYGIKYKKRFIPLK